MFYQLSTTSGQNNKQNELKDVSENNICQLLELIERIENFKATDNKEESSPGK
jgi:hypothetical protein